MTTHKEPDRSPERGVGAEADVRSMDALTVIVLTASMRAIGLRPQSVRDVLSGCSVIAVAIDYVA